MIFGHGVDVQDVNRIRKILAFAEEDFLLSTYTRAERETDCREHERAEFLAGRFAAKEAVAKALGTGFVGVMSFQDVAILRKEGGARSGRPPGCNPVAYQHQPHRARRIRQRPRDSGLTRLR
jgi:holo-[acyl-carrier protein] synthase